jgi:hypothetical protein
VSTTLIVGYDGGADHVVSYAGITTGNVGALIDGAIFTRGTSEKKQHDQSCMLKERLREALIDQAQTGKPTTYNELADRLGLEPPQTIHRLVEALETLMEADVAAGRPMLAALCVSKMWPGVPARGFFLAAKVLGVFSGDPTGPEARAFHADELQRVLSFYGS